LIASPPSNCCHCFRLFVIVGDMHCIIALLVIKNVSTDGLNCSTCAHYCLADERPVGDETAADSHLVVVAIVGFV